MSPNTRARIHAQAHQTSQQILNEVYGESGVAKLPEVNEYISMLADGGVCLCVYLCVRGGRA